MAGNDGYTKLMLHCNGVDGSTTFTDDSASAHTVTAHGNMQIDTAQFKFGSASGLSDGNGDYLQVPDSDDWYLGTGDFTMDWWIKFNNSTSPNPQRFFTQGSGSNLLEVYMYNNKITFTFTSGGSTLVNFAMNSGYSWGTTWHHIAIIRYGTLSYICIDGVAQSISNNSAFGTTSLPNLAADLGFGYIIGGTNYPFNGWVDEIRWSKGIARWTSFPFTPPTEEYTLVADQTVTPSLITASMSIQSPTIVIPMTITVDSIMLDAQLQVPGNIGSMSIITPSTIDALMNLQSPIINISSVITPLTIDANFTLESPLFPGLIEIKNATKIISFNPLVIITNNSPLRIAKIDTTIPSAPVKTIYDIPEAENASDIVYDSILSKVYISCDNGIIVELDSTDFSSYIIHTTGISSDLIKLEFLPGYAMLFAPTTNVLGEVVVMDDAVKSILSTDVRWRQLVAKILNCNINTQNGSILNTDVKWSQIAKQLLSVDVRFNTTSFDDYLEPISRSDFHVFIDNIDATDVKMDEINIYHSEEKSRATFVLARQHDNLDKTLEGVTSQITNQNAVRIEIDGHIEFDGFIHQIDARSETENVQVTAYTDDPKVDERSTVILSVPSINEQLNVHHALVNNPTIENPRVLEDDTNPSFYKGIFIDGGWDETQSISRWESFENSASVAERVSNGEFVPKQNWTYFWFASAKNFVTGEQWGSLNYIGTSPSSLTGDTFEITGMAYKYQRKFDSKKVRLGFGIVYANDFKYVYTTAAQQMYNSLKPHGSVTYKYDDDSAGAYPTMEQAVALQGVTAIDKSSVYAIMEPKIGYRVGSGPYKSISSKSGRLTVADEWVDQPNGLYHHKDASYDYRDYLQQILALEYQKLGNINGTVLPKTSADIEVFLDGYYYHGITLLKRINIDNTTASGIYNSLNGFPVSVKSIEINSGTMKVNLRCDNQWSRTELLEIEATYPDPEDEDYVYPEYNKLQYFKFDPRIMEDVE